METRKNVILALAIATVFLIAMIGSASADEQITSLPFTTNEDGERYYLTGDLTCADTSTAGITIAHNNVVIDGQGHKITGSASASACSDATQTSPAAHSGIRKSADVKNTMIEDIEIVGFCTGIGIEGTYTYTGDEYNTEVTGCEIHDNGDASSITHGVHLTGANNCTITKNEIYNQDGTADMGSCGDGGNGISMHGVVAAGGNYNTITCNYLHDNAKCGLHMKFKCMHNTISYNNVTGNAGAGIMPECKKSDWNTFEYNYIKDNGPYYGFYTRGNNNVIRYNTIINTKGANGHYYGIYIGTAGAPTPYGRYNNIANNTVCGSQAEDIIITGGAADTNTVNNNTCDASSGGTGNGCPWNCAIQADVTIEPETLNLKSNGEWVTAYIELPDCYDVADIDANTVFLGDTIPAVTDAQYGFVTDHDSYLMDHDGDGILERMVKFNRTAVIAYMGTYDFIDDGDTGNHRLAELFVTGEVAGALFEGSDTVRVRV